MNDFFFISSPLHLFMAANLAIQNPANKKTALIISKNRQAGSRLLAVIAHGPDIFTNTVDLSACPLRRGNRRHKSRFQLLNELLSETCDARIFTGNDRRMEFQYAMHVATRGNPQTEGIYLDEGAVTYIGHKSMHRIQHRYIDPFFKQLFYGACYKPAVTTGASAWVNTVYAAFPAAVHPLLQRKNIRAIDPAPFRTKAFKDLAMAMLKDYPEIETILCGIKLVLTLPHEACYIKEPRRYREFAEQLGTYLQPAQIAVKPHPRITNSAVLHNLFPGTTILEHRVGMEAMLPLLDDDCIIAGDISSTLLTTRWLRPDLQVVALTGNQDVPAVLSRLYRTLHIPMISAAQIGTYLKSSGEHKKRNVITP